MAVIGVIDIAMRASTEKFTKGIQDARSALDKFTSTSVRDLEIGSANLKKGLAAAGVALGNIKPGQAAAATVALGAGLALAARGASQLGVGVAKAKIDRLAQMLRIGTTATEDLKQGVRHLGAAFAYGVDVIGPFTKGIAIPLRAALGAAAGGLAKVGSVAGGVFGAIRSTAINAARQLGTNLGAVGQFGKHAASALALVGVAASKVGFPALGRFAGTVAGKVATLTGFLGGLAKQFAQVGLLAAGTVAAGLASFALSSIATIGHQAKLAKSLGVSSSSFTAFEYAVKKTGGPAEALPEILGKLNSTLGAAATMATPAGAALRRLGLDAQTLSKKGAVQAATEIADRLGKIQNPAERAAVAVQIFGEQGVKLDGIFRAGAGGIAAAGAEARELGYSLSDVDTAKAEAAHEAFNKIGTVLTGIGNTLAVQLAPFIEAAANKFTDLAKSGGGVGPTVAKGFGFASTAVGYVVDGVQYLKLAFHAVQSAATKGAAAIVQGLSFAAKGLEYFINKLPGVKVSFSDTLDAISGDLHKLADQQYSDLKEEFAKPPDSGGVKSFFDDLTKSSEKSAEAMVNAASATKGLGSVLGDTGFKVSELETKLKDQIDTFGKSASEIEVYKLKQAGASEADLGRLDGLTRQLKALDDNKKAMEKQADDAKKLVEETRTPFEKLEAERAKINGLFANGLIDSNTLMRGLDKATKDAGLGDDMGKRAGALEMGSKEARSAILSFRAMGADSAVEIQRKTAVNTERVATGVMSLVEFARRSAIGAATATAQDTI